MEILKTLLSTSCCTTGTTGPNSPTIVVTKRMTKLSNGSGNAYGSGPPNASHGCCSSPLALRVCLSMASRISKARMGHDALPLRSQVIPLGCQGAIHASIAWICRRIQIMRVWSRNCCLLSSAYFSRIPIFQKSFTYITLQRQGNGRLRTGINQPPWLDIPAGRTTTLL